MFTTVQQRKQKNGLPIMVALLGKRPQRPLRALKSFLPALVTMMTLEVSCTGENGAFGAMETGAIFVDHTTTSAEIARELNGKAQEFGLSFMDAPVSGGQAGAENGMLTIMVGGSEVDFAKTEPVQQAYAQAVTLMGDVGAGQLTKMVNQITFVGAVQAISEGLVFAENAGLDPKKVIDVISKGAAGSWQLSNRGYTMVDDKFDFGFAVDWARKDLGFAP